MTGPQPETESPESRPISVAELLARNGTIRAPAVTRRRRRRRGDSDSVSVAELTGEIPVIRDDEIAPPAPAKAPEASVAPVVPEAPKAPQAGEPKPVPYWPDPEPRWPKSAPQAQRGSGPQLSAYPRPLGHTDT